MAAVTIASGPERTVIGNKRRVSATLTAPADGDTWDTGLVGIDPGGVSITKIGTTQAAADDASVGSISGGVITFEITGTARNLLVSAVGI